MRRCGSRTPMTWRCACIRTASTSRASSRTPWRPSTAGRSTPTTAEHLEMILAVHGGLADVREDVDAARERIHPATMAAEGPLHELGAISIINSDSQGMGRIGETIRRTWQLAHAMKLWRQTEA